VEAAAPRAKEGPVEEEEEQVVAAREI